LACANGNNHAREYCNCANHLCHALLVISWRRVRRGKHTAVRSEAMADLGTAAGPDAPLSHPGNRMASHSRSSRPILSMQLSAKSPSTHGVRRGATAHKEPPTLQGVRGGKIVTVMLDPDVSAVVGRV